MKEIDDYVQRLKDSGVPAGSALFCGQVLHETLYMPEIETVEDYQFYLNQFMEMLSEIDETKFEPANLMPLAIGFKLAVSKQNIPELSGDTDSLLTDTYLDWITEFSCRPRPDSSSGRRIAQSTRLKGL